MLIANHIEADISKGELTIKATLRDKGPASLSRTGKEFNLVCSGGRTEVPIELADGTLIAGTLNLCLGTKNPDFAKVGGAV